VTLWFSGDPEGSHWSAAGGSTSAYLCLLGTGRQAASGTPAIFGGRVDCNRLSAQGLRDFERFARNWLPDHVCVHADWAV